MIKKMRVHEESCKLKKTPILVITGDPSENEKLKCLNVLEANGFMNKPIKLCILKENIKKIFGICNDMEEEEKLESFLLEEDHFETNLKNEVVIIDNDKLSTGRLVLSLQKKDYTVTEFFNHQQVSFYYYLIHPLFQAIDYYKRNCDSIPIILISNKLLREISVRGIKKLREFESIELYVFVINVIRK